jgi:hypothetical protein
MFTFICNDVSVDTSEQGEEETEKERGSKRNNPSSLIIKRP